MTADPTPSDETSGRRVLRALLHRAERVADGWISPEIRARGEPESARARMLIAQAATLGTIGAFSALYQTLMGEVRFAASGLTIFAVSLSIPIALRRASSHLWVGGLLTGGLFVILSATNFVSAGRAVVPVVFLTVIPLLGTLNQGFRWGLFWAALTLVELLILHGVALVDVTPLVAPNPEAARLGYLRASILVALLTGASGLLHALFNEDVARRIELREAAIEHNRAFYRNMLDTSPDGLFTMDPDGRTNFVNQKLARMVGVEDVLHLHGVELVDLIRGADVERLRSFREGVATSAAMEAELLPRSGEPVPVEIVTTTFQLQFEGGRVFRVRDIRRLREADLEARLLRATFAETPIGVAVLEMDSELIYVNDAYVELTGFDRRNLIGQKLLDLVPSGEARHTLEAIRSALLRGESVSIPRMDWSRMGTLTGYLDVRAFTILPPGEDRPRWVSFVRDVTHLVELEREVARSARIDSLGKLAGGIAHDFNNLLTVIMGQVDTLDEDLEVDHWARSYLATISDACERSSALTSKILDFSRKQTLRPEVFVVRDAVRSLLPILRQLVPERISLEVRIEDEADAKVRCDPTRFEQILLNLVANARDAIEEAGTIAVRIGTRQPEAMDEDTSESSGEVEISVSDDGCGMPREVRDRAFDPFFTTKPVGEGTGLGLSTVHGIVHQSGGRLELDSTPDVGTSLRVYLPETNADPTGRRSSIGRPRFDAEGIRGVVLVVEDDAEVRDLVTRSVERLGFDVVAAQDGFEAQSWIEGQALEFQALVSDIVMPGSNGVEVSRLFRSRFPDKRIVLMSGYAEDEIGPIAQLPTDIRFVHKPLTSKRLAEALMT